MLTFKVCDRCDGHGRSKAWQYTGSICYKCGGSGKIPVLKKGESVYPEKYATAHDAMEALRKLEEEDYKEHYGCQIIGCPDGTWQIISAYEALKRFGRRR